MPTAGHLEKLRLRASTLRAELKRVVRKLEKVDGEIAREELALRICQDSAETPPAAFPLGSEPAAIEIDEAMCPNGHRLVMLDLPAYRTISCDVCAREIWAPDKSYQCETCEYNTCDLCIGAKVAEPSAPSRAPVSTFAIAEPDEVVCQSCGTTFTPDNLFCRTCGTERLGPEVPAGTLREALYKQCGLKSDDFAPAFDLKYSGSSSIKSHRGEEQYILPSSGWQKLGLMVADKYTDEEWLDRGTWPVVYHGTSARPGVVSSILEHGFKIRGGLDRAVHGQRHGVGIYCSPLIEKAMQYAEEPLMVDGVPYTLVFQCRVRPSKYTKPEMHIWLVNDADDIRASGILLRKSFLSDDREIRYVVQNPHHPLTDEWRLYNKLREVRTVREARALGRSITNLHKDLFRGRLTLQGSDCKSIKEAYSKSKLRFHQTFARRMRRKRKDNLAMLPTAQHTSETSKTNKKRNKKRKRPTENKKDPKDSKDFKDRKDKKDKKVKRDKKDKKDKYCKKVKKTKG
mmetsp:Transcript_95186/g.268998  ORF Transcript_95186/g.268998 Transcript_95186/m.268998 type:complete len:514 (-) Transcript_95186:318-1859(-)